MYFRSCWKFKISHFCFIQFWVGPLVFGPSNWLAPTFKTVSDTSKLTTSPSPFSVLQLMAPPPFEHPPRYIRARLYHYHFTPYEHDRSLWVWLPPTVLFSITLGEFTFTLNVTKRLAKRSLVPWCGFMKDSALSTMCRFNQTKAWWYREFKAEYLFPLTWDDQRLEEYLNKLNYLSPVSNSTLTRVLLLPLIFFVHFTQLPDSALPTTPLLTLLTELRLYTDQVPPPLLLWGLFFTGVILTLSMQLLFPDRLREATPADSSPEWVRLMVHIHMWQSHVEVKDCFITFLIIVSLQLK